MAELDRPFRIGISGSYGGLNLGDEAILHAIVKQLRESVTADITVFSRDPDDTKRRHGVERAVQFGKQTREEARAQVTGPDLLIVGGGGILYDQDVEMYLREVALANEEGVPVVVYAVSAGPLKQPSARELVRKHLTPAAAITVRDRQGLNLLEELGISREIKLTADPALLLEPEPLTVEALKSEGLDTQKRLVGFSVREPGPAAPDIDVGHYHALLANTADFMVDRLDAEIVFVPMEHKKVDVQHSHAVVAQMQCAQRARVLKAEYGAAQLLGLVGHFQFTVGMRLHFVIFSAVQGVPFVALPYASKVEGFIGFRQDAFENYVRQNPTQWRGVHGLWDLVRKAAEAGQLDLPREDILFFGTPHAGEVSINSTRVGRVSGANVFDLSCAEWEGRRQMQQVASFLKHYVPGFEDSYIAQSGVNIGVRETRRTVCEHRLTAHDLLSARKFDDVIARAAYPVDIHNPVGKGTILQRVPPGEAYDIPLRALIPKGIENVLVAGRCISGTHEAHSSYRVMPTSMATGQAAGVCAALCNKSGRGPREIDVREVQGELLRQGANLNR